MKTTEPRGSRATWLSLGLAAPLAAATFFTTVAWAAATPATGTSTVALDVAAAPLQPAQATGTTAKAAPSNVKPVARAAAPRTAPATHAKTGASGV